MIDIDFKLDTIDWNTIAAVATLIAALIALFGPKLWQLSENRKKRKQISKILLKSLSIFKKDLIRIAKERNESESTEVKFNSTSFSEVDGYSSLFETVFLANLNIIPSSWSEVITEFFIHYQSNMETIKGHARSNHNNCGTLTRNTVNKLLERVDNIIKKLS